VLWWWWERERGSKGGGRKKTGKCNTKFVMVCGLLKEEEGHKSRFFVRRFTRCLRQCKREEATANTKS
jgi:hypothetical protein